MRTKGLNRPREHHPAVDRGWAQAVHQVWQVDAKERLVLDNEQLQPACYLTISDEHSGACLKALVFPYSRISQVPIEQLQQQLCAVFKC